MTAKGKVFCIVIQAIHALDLPFHKIFRFNVVNIHIFSTSCTPKRDHASLFFFCRSPPCMEKDEGGPEEGAVICKEI